MKVKLIILIAILTTTSLLSQTGGMVTQKSYVLALTTAPSKSFDGKVDSVFKLHVNFIKSLERDGKLKPELSGPFSGINKYSGIYVFNNASIEEAKSIISKDPAYQKLYDLEFYVWFPGSNAE